MEHLAVRWLGPDDLDDVDWLPADRILLPAFRALLRLSRRMAHRGTRSPSNVAIHGSSTGADHPQRRVEPVRAAFDGALCARLAHPVQLRDVVEQR